MMELTDREKRWMKSVPETVPPVLRARDEAEHRCGGCGQVDRESRLDLKRFAGGFSVWIHKKGKCFEHFLRLREKARR